MSTHRTDTDNVEVPRDLETQDVPEDEGVLQPGDSLETDDLSADPLDTGISPAERHPNSERFGVTEAEARQGETLDQRLVQEEPEIPAVPPDAPQEPRSGRLVSVDEGAHPVDAEPRQFAREAGVDGGAASAEEAAVHEVPQDEVVLRTIPHPGTDPRRSAPRPVSSER
jgi:hypothetical protein